MLKTTTTVNALYYSIRQSVEVALKQVQSRDTTFEPFFILYKYYIQQIR